MAFVFDELRAIAARLSNLHATADLQAFSANELKTFMRLAATLRQAAERVLARGSAEINRRSRHELGGAGLARSEGHINPQRMIAILTGTSKIEARKLDRLRKSLMDASPVVPANNEAFNSQASNSQSSDDTVPVNRPWFASIADRMLHGTISPDRMLHGTISPDRFEALRAGLGDSTDAVTAAMLSDAAERILELLHPADSPEVVLRDARQARALLDRGGVLEREKALQAKQEARVWTDRDGMVHLRADFAPEDGAWVKSTLDLLLGPRIGGPRLVRGRAADQSKLIEEDTRSTEQVQASVLVSLLRAGVEIDDNAILAKKRPAVQIVVAATELTRPDESGIAFIEGTGIPVSRRTVNRMVCDTGYVPVILNPYGSPLDLGRDVRLFTPAQRLVIGNLQGGGVWWGCDKPPSFCEVHHIQDWCKGGKTNVNDGVLLCRHHHMLLHNNGSQIVRTDRQGQRYEDSYWLVPPPEKDPEQIPVKLRFRGAVHHSDRAKNAS